MQTLTFVKYENRKLYCKEWHRYASLEDITVAICTGISVSITDYVTGEDITSSVFSEVLRKLTPKASASYLASIIVHLDSTIS